MTVGVISLCGFRKELTGVFYSSSDPELYSRVSSSFQKISQTKVFCILTRFPRRSVDIFLGEVFYGT
jgi:hypothetical protein